MKIVCDSCGAKYSIADEKVQGKVFKIRCKKCSNVIVVKGTGDAEAGGEDLGGGAGAAEWYVVIDGEQVGPVTSVEIDSYFTSGQINAETYAWKDGMGDWMHVVDIPEFTHLGEDHAGPNEATQIADSGHRYDQGETDATNVVHSPLAMNEISDATVSDKPYADPYASEPGYGDDDYGYAAGGDDGGYSGFASSYDSSSGMGVGGELAAAGGDDDGGGMFAAFDTGNDSDFMNFGDAPAPSSNGKSNGSNGSNGSHGPSLGGDMVGQRNENSVLFSLSSLDSVPAVGNSGGEDVPVTEGSGLIDIQALASAHKSMSGGGDMDGGGMDPFAQGTMAMPALMPMGSHRSNNTLYIAVAAGALAVFALAGLGIYLAVKEDPKPPAQEVKIVEREVVRVVESPDQAKVAADAKEAEAAAAAAAAGDPKKVEPEEETDDTKVASAKGKTTKSTRKSAPSKKDEKEDDAPVEKPTKKKDGIDSLLDKIDQKAEEKPESSSSSNLPKQLSRTDVKNTINRYSSRISTCAKSQNKSGKSGTIKVKFYIQPNGRVRGESVVSSEFKGTDVGSCVQKVVGSMTFPKTAAAKDVPVTYPFILK